MIKKSLIIKQDEPILLKPYIEVSEEEEFDFEMNVFATLDFIKPVCNDFFKKGAKKLAATTFSSYLGIFTDFQNKLFVNHNIYKVC